MPLPKGVPETVPVECNGMRGMFHVRCQRVSHQDALIPAARFETLCGRGDAKKWKSSLWYVNEETKTAEMQMSVRCPSVIIFAEVICIRCGFREWVWIARCYLH